MLILRRRPGESFVIGGDITVSVLDTRDGRVRLAIDAPRDVSILRTELLQAMDANRDAAREDYRPDELLELLDTLDTSTDGTRAISPSAKIFREETRDHD